MKTADSQVLPAPPNLIQILMAGFDTVTNHIGLVVFSIVLDLFLWLGPHVRLNPLVDAYFQYMSNFPDITGEMKASREVWISIVSRYNLFSALHTLPVGVPSLIAWRSPLTAPTGNPMVVDLSSPGAVIGLWLLLSAIGLVAGTLYFMFVAQAALVGKLDWRQALEACPWAMAQVGLLVLFWLGVLLAAFIPFFCLFSLLLLFGTNLGGGAFVIYGVLVSCLLVPLIFSPHGIFVYRRNMWASVVEGACLMRLTLPSTGLFLVFLVVLSNGLDVLWQVPAENSWLVLIGVAGHAFVTTGLLAASFIYYREAGQWVQRMIQQARLAANGK